MMKKIVGGIIKGVKKDLREHYSLYNQNSKKNTEKDWLTILLDGLEDI